MDICPSNKSVPLKLKLLLLLLLFINYLFKVDKLKYLYIVMQ